MKNNIVTTLFLLFLTTIAFSQNLILNGSFEETKECVAYIGRFDKVVEWSKPNRGTTDLFNDCLESEAGIPKNYNGNQQALDGHNYAGIYCYSDHDYREYIQGKIETNLEAGKEYKLTFYMSLAEKSDFAIKDFAVLFSKNQLNLTNSDKITTRLLNKDKSNSYQLYPIKNKRYYDNTERWIALELIFTASGFEEYVIIGNFKKNSRTEKRQMSRKNRQNISYYYIDNVSLIEMGAMIEKKVQSNVVVTDIKEPNFELNSIYTLKSILFEFDKATLIKDSTKELDELITYLKKNINLFITINGHTDYLGTSEYNLKLSTDRARSVSDYLISNGILEQRISYNGYGETRPIDPNEPEDAQAKNRRVEFILSK